MYIQYKKCLLQKGELAKLGYPSLKESEVNKLKETPPLEIENWRECGDELLTQNHLKNSIKEILDRNKTEFKECVNRSYQRF